MHDYSLRHLSDDVLLEGLGRLAATDRLTCAGLVAHIVEVERRRLYAPAGCSSMFRYCVDRLRMSADVAYKRVRAARAARRCPAFLAALADGRVNLSGVALLAAHLTRENRRELLAAAEHKSRREILCMLARRFPAAGPGSGVSFHSGTEAAPLELGAAADRAAIDPEPVEAPLADVTSVSKRQAPGPVPVSDAPATRCGTMASERTARLTPIAPGLVELVAILGEEACAQLEESRELLGHAVPSGSLVEVLERAIALQHARLRQRRCGATKRPGADTSAGLATDGPRVGAGAGAAASTDTATPGVSMNPRHVPADVQRQVWDRDGGQCAFVSADGHRCGERIRVEIDHIVPVARGGRATVENLRLLCHPHNLFVAEREFGEQHMRDRRGVARRERAAERLRKQAERERAERRGREIARQREELGEAFRHLGYRGPDLERALAYCAGRPEAPLEERLKHALGYTAPRALKESPAPKEPAPPPAHEAA